MEHEESAAVWAGDPERVDPDDYGPGSPFVRQITWAPCDTCSLQVHAPVTQVVYRGLVCPRCGAELLPAVEDPEGWLQRVLREEDELSEQL
ncbi:MAG: hypothetical protein FJX77_05550 [Armatimonadetes bacterium]|nr:hypothetical protein [Armatimonadota bacterium]